MKVLFFALILGTLVMGLTACEQAQQALDTIDKAKLLKDDIEKKATEVRKKAVELIPGPRNEPRDNREEKDEQRRGKPEEGRGRDD